MDTLLHLARELWGERRRGSLVAIGVVWGTLSLVLLLSIGGEMVRATSFTADQFGRHLLRFSSGATTRPFAGMAAGRQILLRPEDGPAVLAAVPEIRDLSIEYSTGGNPLEFEQQRLNVNLVGVEASFGDLRGQTALHGGRFLNRRDVDEHRRVVFLGGRVKRRLFGERPAVGAEVRLHGQPFTVIGVLTDRTTFSAYNGHDSDKVSIPASTFRDLLGWTSISFLMVGLHDPAHKDVVADAVYRVLGRRHGFDPSDRDAVEMQDYIGIRDYVDSILDGNRVFTLIVGILGFLVAVVGVANLMFVMVEERKREIGVQMALGAKPRRLILERLSEGVVVTLLGGAVGIAVCALLLWGFDQVPLDPEARGYLGRPQVSLPLGAAVTLLLAVAGAAAGWFPARRAAALDPVEALREE